VDGELHRREGDQQGLIIHVDASRGQLHSSKTSPGRLGLAIIGGAGFARMTAWRQNLSRRCRFWPARHVVPTGAAAVAPPIHSRRNTMKVMVMVKATKSSEAGEMPDVDMLTAMGQFNEELVKAGVMLAGEGLHPSVRGKRVRFSGRTRTVVDGPFAETKELVAGFWLWQVKSMDEAVEWVRRCPNPMPVDSEIEIRPVFEAADFGAEFTPELQAQEERLRAQVEAGTGKPR
jgi:hypothetical protein